MNAHALQETRDQPLEALDEAEGPVREAELQSLESELAAAAEGRMAVLQLGRWTEPSGEAEWADHVRSLESLSRYVGLMLRQAVVPVSLVGSRDARRGRAAHVASAAYLGASRSVRFKSYTALRGGDLDESQPAWRRRASGGTPFSASAHLLGLESVHAFSGNQQVELLRELANPVRIRVSPRLPAADLLTLCARINPRRTPGKVVLVSSMGKMVNALKGFILALHKAKLPAVWLCDPTWESGRGHPSAAAVTQMITEVEETAKLHAALDSRLAGLCLEMGVAAGPGSSAREPLGGEDSAQVARPSGFYPAASGLDFIQSMHVCSDFAQAMARME